MTYVQALLIAIIEGLTEFLPVSSTGHMILAEAILKVQDKRFAETFEIVIQLGAIMAVVVMYLKRFLVGLNIYFKLAVAFIPTAIMGLLAYKTIKHYLFNPMVVSITLIAGGIVLILLDKWSAKKESRYADVADISYGDAIKIGLFQCLSMIPGMSRAAATIFGGVYAGFNRQQAAEFSFLLAVPTMFAASGLDLFEERDNIHSEDIKLLLFGAAIAFVVALFAIRGFIAFLTRYGFKHFGWYRIVLGLLFLAFAYYTGLELSA